MQYKQKLSHGHPWSLTISKVKSVRSIPNLAFKHSVMRTTPAGSLEALIGEPWWENRRQFAQRSAFAQILLHRRLKDDVDLVRKPVFIVFYSVFCVCENTVEDLCLLLYFYCSL